jgi:hypothetical protein
MNWQIKILSSGNWSIQPKQSRMSNQNFTCKVEAQVKGTALNPFDKQPIDIV